MTLTSADDRLHPPASAEPWWTETYWFSFDQPGRDLSATIYPLFRPNLGVCSLGVFLWDGGAHEPWAVRYGWNFWHVPMPPLDATEIAVQGLRYRVLEPLNRYSVTYRDGDLVSIDLEYTGLRPPHEASLADGRGHYDQPCRVTGEVVLRGERITVDTIGMRDRTWAPRPEDRHGTGTAYTFGNASGDDQFLMLTSLTGNEGGFVSGAFNGYLVRDGVKSPLTDARRRVVERRHGYPVRLEVEAVDEAGRRLEATGTVRNRLANQANPCQFAWMSMVAWDVAGGPPMIGEDQEVWSPDRLGGSLASLDM